MSQPAAHTVDFLFEAVQTLRIDDQYALYNRMCDVLHGGPDSDMDDRPLSPEWTAEIDRRLAAEEAGLAKFYSLEEVMVEARLGFPGRADRDSAVRNTDLSPANLL
jgi:hypothetical protein